MAEDMAFNKFKFKGGETYRGIKAQDAGEELERIRERNGGQLQTEAVVKAAASKRSPIHGAFTWDDSKAGHMYRLWEARQFIRMVVIEAEGEQPPLPAYAHIPRGVATAEQEGEEESGSYYQSTRVLAQSPDEFDAAMRESRSRLSSAKRSLEALERLAGKTDRQRVRRAASYVEKATQAIAP